MKSKLLFLTMLAFITALLAFRIKDFKKQPRTISSVEKFKKKNIVRCSPDWNELKEWIEELDIPLIPGAGIYKWKISTKNDSAQLYFNQGINMYYSFHIIEAMASFKKAAKFDPGCAMLYWAQALCYGPNINDFGYRASPDALAAVAKSKELASHSTPIEKELIDAMSVRYTADSADATRASLNQAYVDMMKKVYKNYPANPDAQALYADAMMLQHPWNLWDINGTPKPWTSLIRDVLERLLTKFPNHPGGNHYYIHVMEPSPFAAKALPSAERLGKTNPGLSHVVHMPSHIFLRTGHYQKGVDVNNNAVNSYQQSISLYAPVTSADFLYLIHNLHMKTNNAMLAGNFKISEEAATETRISVPYDYLSIPAPMGNYVQYIYMTPLFVDIRFGRWDELLNYPQPAASQIYSNVLYHFGRGIAFSHKQNLDDAGKELDKMREFMKDSSLNIPFTPFSAAIEGAKVAEQLLLGIIHEQRKLYDGAIWHFRQADSIEVNMVYNEPRDWLLNPKHYLGNAYIKAGKFVDAISILQKDLLNNSENGWALFGLWEALTAKNKPAEGAKILTRFKKAFDKADVKLYGPVF